MKSSVTIAGVRFLLPVEVADHDEDWSDLDVDVAWVADPSGVAGIVLAAPSEQSVTISLATGADSAKRERGCITLRPVDDANAAGYWQLRQVAPIVAAFFDRLTLHASAVHAGNNVAAFVGASETGKSTLAWELTKAGALAVADDLVPIRFVEGSPVVHTGTGPLALSGVFFASREGDEPRITPLATSEAFDLHLRNGFGEHENPAIWAFQFDAYHTLVEAVPHFTLSVPDDRERLGAAASWLLTELAAITNVA